MLVYVLPNIIWLVMPILSILEVSGNIFRCIDNKINSKEQDQRIEMKKLV